MVSVPFSLLHRQKSTLANDDIGPREKKCRGFSRFRSFEPCALVRGGIRHEMSY